MTAPCPKFGFIITRGPTQDAQAFVQALAKQLADVGLEVEATGDAATIVVTREGSQATESDRRLVIDLLNRDSNAGTATVSDLVDLNY